MSTLTITDLPAGTAATSANVNATMTSWNTATAAGQIGAANVRPEGIDRRTMSATAHVVATTEIGTNDVNQISTVGAFTHSTGVYAVVPIGQAAAPYLGTLRTNTMTVAATSQVIVHASTYFVTSPEPTGTPSVLVTLALQRSADGGATWATITGTERAYQMRESTISDRDAAGNRLPAIAQSCTWALADNQTGSLTYRVVYKTANDSTAGGSDVNFQEGSIFVEVIGT